MDEFYVYFHITPSNRIYVGISCDPVKRWRNGRGYEKNYLFNRAIQKYGWNSIRHIIIPKPFDHKTARQIEKAVIKELHLTDPRYGLNLDGGGNAPISPYTRELMSKVRKGRKTNVGRIVPQETRIKVSNGLKRYYESHPGTMLGKHHSEETIDRLRHRLFSDETLSKMSANHADFSGDKNPSAKPIRQLSMDGVLIAEYPYAKVAAQKYNLDLSSIIKCCRHPEKHKSHGGYRWEYADQAS